MAGPDAGRANAATALDVFRKYAAAEGNAISRAQFELNLADKIRLAGLWSDVPPLLRPSAAYNAKEACRLVEKELLAGLGSGGNGQR